MNTFDLLQRASLFGLAALAVALLLQWALANRVPARWRVWIWRVALVQTALMLVPLAPIALSVLPARAPIAAPPRVEAPAIESTMQAPATNDAPALPATSDAPMPRAEVAPPAMTGVADAPAPRSLAAPGARFSAPTLALWIYGLGIAFQLALLARNIVRVRRALRACVRLDNAVLRPIAARLQMRRLPRLLQSAGGSPFLVGIARPTIVVPQTLNCAHEAAVFAHELAHLRRHDLAWNALLWALQTLLWFHPLSWLSRRFHALEVESACDELTLQLTSIAPQSYGALLISAETPQSSPLTAGVNDGFFALQTRLKRLACAPIQPRRRAAWLLGAALLVSFAAVVPLRLVSRAQSENAETTMPQQSLTGDARSSNDIAGVLLDYQSKPVANATVWAIPPMPTDEPLATARTDADGKFRLPNAHIHIKGQGNLDMELFADAGARGVGSFDVSGDASQMRARLTAPTRVAVRFVDEQNQPISDLQVRVRAVGDSVEERTHQESPPDFYQKFRAVTDAQGEATLSGLPSGAIAHLVVEGQSARDPKDFVPNDWRGGRFAPLAVEDAVSISAPVTRKTIRLLAPVRLEGRALQPDGTARTNVKIGARQLSAAQIAGTDKSRAGVVYRARTDANGRYSLDGLRPGRYHVWVAPNPQLTQEFVGPELTRDLTEKINQVDLPLSRGALIQGVVVSRATQKPVKGQTMGLIDSQNSHRYAITDARGYFRFRVLGGAQHLWIHANGTNSPPPGFAVPAKNEFDFALENGQKRDFRLELLSDPVQKPVQIRGVVTAPDGANVAGAQVLYRVMGERGVNLKTVPTDAKGRFSFALKAPARVAQMWAQKGDSVTPLPVVTTADREAKLRIAKGAWSQIAGRVTDETGRAVAGAKVERIEQFDTFGVQAGFATTDARGDYRFARVRPGLGQLVRVIKDGYALSASLPKMAVAGQTLHLDAQLRSAPATLAGTMYDEKGQLARGYEIGGGGQNRNTPTGMDGRFFVPQITQGKTTVYVFSPDGRRSWRVPVTGGARNFVIRLSAVAPSKPRKPPQSAGDPALLVGKTAPPLRVAKWSNGQTFALDKLRGQTVILAFDSFIQGRDGGMRDFARSFPKVQVIGVQTVDPDLAKYPDSPLTTSAEQAAQSAGFPIAVDAPLPGANVGWQTAKAYGNAPYVVIGPDGKVVYAGDKLDRALASATTQ